MLVVSLVLLRVLDFGRSGSNLDQTSYKTNFVVKLQFQLLCSCATTCHLPTFRDLLIGPFGQANLIYNQFQALVFYFCVQVL